MKKSNGLVLLEVMVVLLIMVFGILMVYAYCHRGRHYPRGVVCGTNLKGLGNGMTVYANDYDGQYVCAGMGFDHTWADATDQWQEARPNWENVENITVGTSLYLLVRLADVSPKSFVCPMSDQEEFSGKNPHGLDIVELWDFGTYQKDPGGRWDAEGPAQCVSYSYHQSYDPAGEKTGRPGRFRADDTRSAAFAVMADRNPWYDPKLEAERAFDSSKYEQQVLPIFDYWNLSKTDTLDGTQRRQVMAANSQPHERQGQNVMFADGHNSFEKTSDVGVKNDNIYTRHDMDSPEREPLRWRRGATLEKPDRHGMDETPAAMDDSFLVNDFVEKVR